MTKKTSIVILCVAVALILFVGVFTFMPVGLNYGESGVFHSPLNLIQKSSLFTDEVSTKYAVELDENTTANSVVSLIKSRLASMYGYYGCEVKYDSATNILTVSVPKTSDETKSSVSAILSTVTATGKVELSTSQTYSEDSVLLTTEHLKSASSKTYNASAQNYYITEVKLTDAGSKALATISSSSYLYGFVDGSIISQVVQSSGILQMYFNSKADSERVAAYINGGVLGAELSWDDDEEIVNDAGIVCLCVIAALIVATWVFYAVRYKTLGVSGIISSAVSVILFTIISGLIYSEILNAFAIAGFVLGYAMVMVFTVSVLEKIKEAREAGKTLYSAIYTAFSTSNKLNLIVHGIALVVGIVLWLIPTVVTAPLGCALTYMAVCSFIATMAINRLFVNVMAALVSSEK